MIEQLDNVMNLNPDRRPTARYKAFIPGRQFLGSGTNALDVSGNAAHAAFGSSLTDALGWANNGWLTTATGTNGYAAIPLGSSSFDLSTQSVLFHMRMLKPSVVTSENVAGNAQPGTAHQGFYLSLRAGVTGGISKLRPVFRSSGGDFSSLADSTATFGDRALTLSATPAAGATSVTLASNFSGTTGTYQMKFDNGDVRYLGFTNGSTTVTGVAAGTTALTGACTTAVITAADSTYHDITLAIDLVSASQSVKLYCDGTLSDNYTASLPTGTTTADTGFAIGAQIGLAGATSSAQKTAGIHLLAWTGTMPSNIDQIAARLAGNPFIPLADRDFW